MTWAQLTAADPLPTHVHGSLPGGRAPPTTAREAAAREVASAMCGQGDALSTASVAGDVRARRRAARDALVLYSMALRHDGGNAGAWRGRATVHLAMSELGVDDAGAGEGDSDSAGASSSARCRVSYAHLAAADAYEAIERDAAMPAGCAAAAIPVCTKC